MKHAKKEILDALKLIKDECEATHDCHECPFAGADGCILHRDAPYRWGNR